MKNVNWFFTQIGSAYGYYLSDIHTTDAYLERHLKSDGQDGNKVYLGDDEEVIKKEYAICLAEKKDFYSVVNKASEIVLRFGHIGIGTPLSSNIFEDMYGRKLDLSQAKIVGYEPYIPNIEKREDWDSEKFPLYRKSEIASFLAMKKGGFTEFGYANGGPWFTHGWWR